MYKGNIQMDENSIAMRELLTGKKILVVDDDDDYAEALEEIFMLHLLKRHIDYLQHLIQPA